MYLGCIFTTTEILQLLTIQKLFEESITNVFTKQMSESLWDVPYCYLFLQFSWFPKNTGI